MAETSINDIKKNCADDIKAFKKLKRKHPIVSSSSNCSPFNLIQELHLDNKNMYENAHTRLLGAILKYDMQFLHSFLERCCGKIYVQKTKVKIEVERQYVKENGAWKNIKNNRLREGSYCCRPDCLVWKKDRIAVIIENKINRACETTRQVENYIEAIYGDPNIFSSQSDENYKKIWVIYLGGDTAEMPSDKSLNNANKLFLIKGDNRGPGKHLCLVSYKDVIIPWLEEDVLPKCPFGITGLTGGLMVYIDYLKHRFEDNSSEEERFYNSSPVIQLFEKVDKKISPFYYEKYIAVSNYLAGESDREDEKEDKDHSFYKALRFYYLNHHFCFKDPQLNEKWMIRTTGAFVHVWKKVWEHIQDKPHPTCDLYFELYPYQIDTYMHNPEDFINSKRAVTCRLNYKGKDNKFKTQLNQKLKGIEEIGEFIFNKDSQKSGKQLTLKSDGAFFDSFVDDNTITQMCTIIDTFLKNY